MHLKTPKFPGVPPDPLEWTTAGQPCSLPLPPPPPRWKKLCMAGWWCAFVITTKIYSSSLIHNTSYKECLLCTFQQTVCMTCQPLHLPHIYNIRISSVKWVPKPSSNSLALFNWIWVIYQWSHHHSTHTHSFLNQLPPQKAELLQYQPWCDWLQILSGHCSCVSEMLWPS